MGLFYNGWARSKNDLKKAGFDISVFKKDPGRAADDIDVLEKQIRKQVEGMMKEAGEIIDLCKEYQKKLDDMVDECKDDKDRKKVLEAAWDDLQGTKEYAEAMERRYSYIKL